MEQSRFLFLSHWSEEKYAGYNDAMHHTIDHSQIMDIPEDQYNEFEECNPHIRYSLGVQLAQQVQPFLPTPGAHTIHEAMDPHTLQQHATMWEGTIKATQRCWRMDVIKHERFLSILSADAWEQFIRQENIFRQEDGMRDYADMLLSPIIEPVCIIEHADTSLDIWDGWHRIACAVVKQEPIHALFGYIPHT